MTGALLAADLVNLGERSVWTVPEVQAVFREHVIRWSDVDKSDVPALRRWTTRLRAVFVAPDEEQRCRSINALLLDGVASV
ncbi:hypothetical protein [Rhodococcus aetherivorans]